MTCYGTNVYKRLRKQYNNYWISPLSLGSDLNYSISLNMKVGPLSVSMTSNIKDLGSMEAKQKNEKKKMMKK